MKAEVEIKVGGAKHRLAMPLGGLEMVAEVNPVIKEVYGALLTGVWRLDELRAVLNAGIRYGESTLDVHEIIDEFGLEHRDANGVLVGGAAKVAADLLGAAFKDDKPGNASAVAENRRAESVSH